MPDNPSTEIALIHLIRDELTPLRERMSRLEQIIHQQNHQIMTALETLTAAVNANTQGQANLTTAVNAAIVQLGQNSPTDAQLLSLATAIEANTQSDVALTTALLAAVNPTPTPTP